jgi:Cu-Zn family superoxide dismutase
MILFMGLILGTVSADDQSQVDELLRTVEEPSQELAGDMKDAVNTTIKKMTGQATESSPDNIKDSKPMNRATALLKGTATDSIISGEVEFIETAEGLMVLANLKNVPPGKHGFHIHENGSCEEEGKAAGGHFNPDQVNHGFLPHDGHAAAHAGDMGNIEVKENGEAVLSLLLADVNLSGGAYNVLGKSVILHEKEDDFSQPTGNAGGRIGCGIIEAYKE